MPLAVEDLGGFSFGRLLRWAFKLYVENFVLFVSLVATPLVLVFLVQLGLTVVSFSYQEPVPSGAPFDLRSLWETLPAWLKLALALAFSCTPIALGFAQAATTAAVRDIVLGRPPGLTESFSQLRGKTFRLIGLSLLLGITIYLGLWAYLVPGLALAALWALAVPAVVFENLKVRAALGRSRKLARANYGSFFGLTLLAVLLTTAAGVACVLVFTVLLALFPELGPEWSGQVKPLYVLRGAVVYVGAPALGASPIMIFLALSYLNQWTRKNGLTPESLEAALAQS